MGLGAEIIRVQESLAADRATFEAHWQEVAPLVLSRQDNFFNETSPQGEKKADKKFDDTATLALERFAAAKESVRTPRAAKWHKIIPLDDKLLEDKSVMNWCDKYTDFLFKMRYRPAANYAKQQHECYMSDGAFGTSVLIVEDRVGSGALYKSSHIAEHYLMENMHGIIDRDYRRYKLTALQAAEKYEELPPIIMNTLEKEPHQTFEFIHCVIPDEDNETKGMKYKSIHVAVEGQMLLKLKNRPAMTGYKTFPYIVDRHLTAPNEVYGRSPAMNALSEIKMLNAMRKTDIRARHMAVDPPILAADQQSIRRFSMKPNAINYGTIDMAGNPLVRPYQTGGRIDVSNDGIEQSRQFINDSFYVTLFQILIDQPTMTATEVLQRAQEKAALIAPVMTHDTLGQLIERETSIYEEYGIFEDGQPLELPPALKESGGAFGIEYTSPLAKAQRAEEALATERTVQAMLPLAQIDPSILAPIDWQEYAEIMRQANGAPSRLFKSKERLMAEEQAKAAQQEAMMVAQALPQVASSVKDIAQAQSYAQ